MKKQTFKSTVLAALTVTLLATLLACGADTGTDATAATGSGVLAAFPCRRFAVPRPVHLPESPAANG